MHMNEINAITKLRIETSYFTNWYIKINKNATWLNVKMYILEKQLKNSRFFLKT